jgi:hypothetical protein
MSTASWPSPAGWRRLPRRYSLCAVDEPQLMADVGRRPGDALVANGERGLVKPCLARIAESTSQGWLPFEDDVRLRQLIYAVAALDLGQSS